MNEIPPAPPPVEPEKPSQTNFAGALLLSILLVTCLVLNLFGGDRLVAPNWLLWGLMLGILFLLGVDVSKILRGRGGQ